MRGPTQANWLHSVPKRANAGGRINITFRRAINTAGTNKYVFNVTEQKVGEPESLAAIIITMSSPARYIGGRMGV
jgi:hypothetical protein